MHSDPKTQSQQDQRYVISRKYERFFSGCNFRFFLKCQTISHHLAHKPKIIRFSILYENSIFLGQSSHKHVFDSGIC